MQIFFELSSPLPSRNSRNDVCLPCQFLLRYQPHTCRVVSNLHINHRRISTPTRAGGGRQPRGENGGWPSGCRGTGRRSSAGWAGRVGARNPTSERVRPPTLGTRHRTNKMGRGGTYDCDSIDQALTKVSGRLEITKDVNQWGNKTQPSALL